MKHSPFWVRGKQPGAGVVEIGAGAPGLVVVVVSGFAVRGVLGCEVDVLPWADGDEAPPQAAKVRPERRTTTSKDVRPTMERRPEREPVLSPTACFSTM
jgi:hypothetical protein